MSKPNNSVKIHLTEPALTQARNALIEQAAEASRQAGVLPSDAYRKAQRQYQDLTGPDFVGCVVDLNIDAAGVQVTLLDGTVYAYPVHTVSRVKYYRVEA